MLSSRLSAFSRTDHAYLISPDQLGGYAEILAPGEVFSDYTGATPEEKAIKRYTRRWGCETMHQAMKSRGFHLEGSHVTDTERMTTLFGVVVLASSVVLSDWGTGRKPRTNRTVGAWLPP